MAAARFAWGSAVMRICTRPTLNRCGDGARVVMAEKTTSAVTQARGGSIAGEDHALAEGGSRRGEAAAVAEVCFFSVLAQVESRELLPHPRAQAHGGVQEGENHHRPDGRDGGRGEH